jgi:hypothetical protein
MSGNMSPLGEKKYFLCKTEAHSATLWEGISEAVSHALRKRMFCSQLVTHE